MPTEDGHTIWLFAGSDSGGAAAAVFYTLSSKRPRATVTIHGWLWLTRVLEAIGRDRDLTNDDALLPWAMAPASNPA